MAWIEKRGKKLMVGWREPDGTVRRQSAPDRIQAKILKADVEKKLLERSYVTKDDRAQPFIEYLTGVYASDLTIREVTRVKYESVIRLHLAPRLGAIAVGALSPTLMRRVFADLSKEQGAWTTFECFKVTRRAVRQAMGEGLMHRDPLAGVRIEAPRRKDIRILTPAEVGALADVIEPRFRAMVLVAAWGGLRLGELGALTRGDIEGDIVTVSKAVSTPNGRARVEPPKSAASNRRVTLPAWVAQELREHLLRYPNPSSAENIFWMPDGSPVTHSNFARTWRAACKEAKIEAKFHGLRHTQAALLIQQGAHPKLIQSRMGHSSITMTMDVYGHLFPTADAELAAGLEQFAPKGAEVVNLHG